MKERLVTVGVVAKPFGVHGDVYVRPDVDLEHDFPPGCAYETPTGVLVVERSRLHSGRRVVRFAGVEDRDAAEALRGGLLTLPRSQVTLDEDAFWTEDLLGREVVDDAGTLVGVIENTLDGLAHDYLVVARPDGGEVLVPAVAELVDVDGERVVVHAIPGLLDPDAAEDVGAPPPPSEGA